MVKSKTNPGTIRKTPNLEKTVKKLEKNFNERSIRFMKPDLTAGISIDETLKMSQSKKQPLRTYMPLKPLWSQKLYGDLQPYILSF